MATAEEQSIQEAIYEWYLHHDDPRAVSHREPCREEFLADRDTRAREILYDISYISNKLTAGKESFEAAVLKVESLAKILDIDANDEGLAAISLALRSQARARPLRART